MVAATLTPKLETVPLAIEAQQIAERIESGEIPPYGIGTSRGDTPEHARLRDRLAYHRIAAANFREMLRQCGQRYAQASFSNYRCAAPGQREAVKKLRDYAQTRSDAPARRQIRQLVSSTHESARVELQTSAAIVAGSSVLLSGPKGIGKDHLLVALARECVHHWGTDVRWINGLDMYRRLRAVAMGDAYESDVSWLTDVEVLYISDPLPPSGSLTEFQQAELFRVVDERYRHLRPTWISLNVTSPEEAEQRLGAAVVDRLRDGALQLHCSWPSFRTQEN